MLAGQRNDLPGIIPSLFYRGSITNRFDFNVFASTTFIPVKSTVDGRNYPGRNSEIYVQPSLIYKYSGELNFAAGYTYIRGNSFKAANETEQQLWQQVIVEHKALKGMMLHRFRLVENLKKGVSPVLNYQVAFEKPLEGRVLDAGEFYFTCFNESFLNQSGTSRFYSSNWTFLGLGFKTLKAGRIEFGPLIQTMFTSERSHDTLYLLQILWLGDSGLFKRSKHKAGT
jgi:hypothetical protein